MRVQVVSVESGTKFTDGQERVTLRFKDADSLYSEIRIPRGLTVWAHRLNLDDVIEIDIVRGEAKVGENSIEREKNATDAALTAMAERKAKAGRHES